MATITEAKMKRCSRCNFSTQDEADMHAHILEQRNNCGATFYRDEALSKEG